MEYKCLMKTALKNSDWLATIICAIMEFPMIIFLSYFSLGSKEIIMEIYQTDPIRIFCIKGCISFIIVSIIMHSIILLLVLIIKWILNV